MLGKHACDLQVWHQRRVPSGLYTGAKYLHVARAQCFFIRHQVGNAKVHPRTEFGVASSKFTFTGGPLVKKNLHPTEVANGF